MVGLVLKNMVGVDLENMVGLVLHNMVGLQKMVGGSLISIRKFAPVQNGSATFLGKELCRLLTTFSRSFVNVQFLEPLTIYV
jgi:hypothetical protein